MNKVGSGNAAAVVWWEETGVEVLLAIHHCGTSMIVK